MSAAPKLSELQSWMKWIITEPGGVGHALVDTDERYALEPKPSCRSVISESPGFSQIERLDVYAEGYYLRILNSLKEDYLAVARWMGDEEFRSLISDYLLDHPSRTPELLELGRRLPDYLAGWLEPDQAPFLRDLARLEWAHAFAYFAENPEPWDPRVLASPDEEALGRLKLEAAPATAVIASDWKIHELRTALRASDWSEQSHRPESLRANQWLVVYRNGFAAETEEVSEPEFRLIEWATQGLGLGLACERFSEFSGVTSEQLLQWLSKWAGRGAVACRGGR